MDDELASQICGILTHAPEAHHRVLVFVTGDGNAHKVGAHGDGFGLVGVWMWGLGRRLKGPETPIHHIDTLTP